MQIIAKQSDGTETDVTEAVQVIYDAMHSWMSMASGSLDKEEWDAILHLAEAADFPDYADLKARRELEDREEAERREKRLKWEAEQAAAREEGRRLVQERRQEIRGICASMRVNEPGLAGYPDAALMALHRLRQRGAA